MEYNTPKIILWMEHKDVINISKGELPNRYFLDKPNNSKYFLQIVVDLETFTYISDNIKPSESNVENSNSVRFYSEDSL